MKNINEIYSSSITVLYQIIYLKNTGVKDKIAGYLFIKIWLNSPRKSLFEVDDFIKKGWAPKYNWLWFSVFSKIPQLSIFNYINLFIKSLLDSQQLHSVYVWSSYLAFDKVFFRFSPKISLDSIWEISIKYTKILENLEDGQWPKWWWFNAQKQICQSFSFNFSFPTLLLPTIAMTNCSRLKQGVNQSTVITQIFKSSIAIFF